MNANKFMRFPATLLRKIWRGLTEPFETLPNIGDQRRSVTTSAFLIVSIVAVAIEQMLAGNTPRIALILLIAGYFLARTRWFKFAALMLVFALTIPSYLVALRLTNPDSSRISSAFGWVIIPLLLSSLIYSIRVTAAISIINFLALTILPTIKHELDYRIMGGAIGFYGLTSIILIIVMVQRNEIEEDRKKELVISRKKLSAEIVERERYAEQAQRRAEELAMLNEVSSAISSLQDLTGILDVIYEQVKRHLHLNVFFVALYDDKNETISFPIIFDNEDRWQDPSMPVSKALHTAKVIQTGQPFLWNRTEAEIDGALSDPNRVGDKTHVAASILISPLLIGNRTIGAISAQSYTLNAYNENDLYLLTGIANHVAIAIQNSRFLEEVKRNAEKLSTLNEVGRAVSELTDLPTLLESVYVQTKRTLLLDTFYIGLYQLDSDEIVFPIMYDGGKRFEPTRSKINEGTVLSRLRRGEKASLINRRPEELELTKSENRLGETSRISASLMIAPLTTGSQVIGVISAQSYALNAYSERDLDLLTGIGNQVAVAIQNTRLLEETKQTAGYLATLNELGRVISELRNLPELLDIIYTEVKKLLNVDAFYVGLYNPDENTVSYPIMYDEEVRYQPAPDILTTHSFLYQLMHGEKAQLTLRSKEELELIPTDRGMLGNEAKKSASLLTAPLKVGEQVIGVISAQSYTFDAYTETDLNLLVGIGNQVGVAIQNARLVEAIKQNVERLAILNEVSRAIAELRDLPELLNIIYEQVKKNIAMDVFFVGLYHPETHEVSFPIVYDEGQEHRQDKGPVSEDSFLNRFLKGEKLLLINRTAAEIEARPADKARTLGNEDKLSASFLVTPLIAGESVIGLVSAQSYTMNAYDRDDLDLLIQVASQISIAIENSRLYTAAQQEIAERQRIEEQLRAAETKYRELVERVPAVIYSSETGATGRWFYVSPQIEALLGFTPEEWIANPDLWYQQIHPEDREYAVATEAKLLAEGSRLETEYRMYTKSGQVLWIHDESMNVSVSDNALYIVQGFLMDVTLRKQAELTLKESEAKYHSLFITAERQARELTLLSEVQNALSRELDLSILINTVVEAIAKTFGYIFVSLYKLEDGSLQLQHQVGYESVIERISPTEGISGRVVKTGQPILIQDVTEEEDFLRASPHIHSEICVPLFDGDEIFGTLNVESSHEYQLTEDDLRLINTLSEQVNIAIRRARLYADRAEGLRREQHINEFAHALSSTLDLPGILEIVARLSVELIGAETGTVSIMSDDGSEMTNIYNFNEAANLNAKLPKGQGLTWLVYEKGRPVVVDEYAQHPMAAPEWSASGLHAFMGVPITAGEKHLGVMALYNRTPDNKFTQRDLSLIEALAREVAIAIQNARLFDALQKELLERESIEAELQKERDFAVQMTNALGQGVSVTTANNIYEFVNPALARMLGYSPEEMIGKSTDLFIYPDDLEKLLEERQKRQQGISNTYETRGKHKDGHPVHVLVTGVPRYIDGRAAGSISAITDLTERKQIELEREALLKEMEAKNAELERFTYSVSHDLKSPLVTIGGFIGFLEADISKGETQRIGNTISRIRDAAKKMQRLLDELLELSRIGRLINPPVEVPFGELVREALELAHGQLTEKQVQLEVEADLPVVNVDRVRMVEVLQNLIVNAAKFMGGQENPIIQIGMQVKNNERAFFVKDNGIGIAPEYHTKVFGLFDKLDAKSEGTGIGLALVKRIVEVHGGTIWVESEFGKGATFFFTLEPKK